MGLSSRTEANWATVSNPQHMTQMWKAGLAKDNHCTVSRREERKVGAACHTRKGLLHAEETVARSLPLDS